MQVKASVKITRKEMYDYLLYNSYSSILGVLVVIFGIVNLAMGINGLITGNSATAFMYIAFGVIFIFSIPILLWVNAGVSVRSTELFKKPIEYVLDDEGIHASQDDKSDSTGWDAIVKVRATRLSILLYVSKRSIIVIPRASLGTQQTQAIEIISTHVDSAKVRIRQ